jgi:hypothetical protein
MPPISDLDSSRRGTSGTVSIGSGSISTDDLDVWVSL